VPRLAGGGSWGRGAWCLASPPRRESEFEGGAAEELPARSGAEGEERSAQEMGGGGERFGARTTLEPPSLLAPSLPFLHRWSYSVAAGRDAAEGSRGVNVAARTARAAASPSARGAGRYREERE